MLCYAVLYLCDSSPCLFSFLVSSYAFVEFLPVHAKHLLVLALVPNRPSPPPPLHKIHPPIHSTPRTQLPNPLQTPSSLPLTPLPTHIPASSSATPSPSLSSALEHRLSAASPK